MIHGFLPRRSRPGGFTLIELLVVILIIAILASLILATAGFVQEKAARSRIEGEISAIETALESYKIDNGTYPVATNSTKEVIEALMPKNTADGKTYFEFPNRMLSSTNDPQSGDLLDAFGNPYHYQFPGEDDRNGTNFFDLWSTGKKANEADTNKWIVNW